MLKKLLIFLTIIPFVLTGCKSSHKLETASIIENVSVHKQDGQLIYTFFILTDSDTPNAVAINANSFEEAQSLAAEKYIPDMSLSKLELLLIQKDAREDVMQKDIEYISTQASFSPIARVAVCDSSVIEEMRRKSEVQNTIKNLIILCKKNNSNVKTDYLSVFNSFYGGGKTVTVPYISGKGELRVSAMEIRCRNNKKSAN